MKISVAWLNHYLDRPVDAEEAERVLTDVGFPLDGVERLEGDAVLDVEVTSNRSDCLSHVGIARELAAATGRTLRPPQVMLREGGTPVQEVTSVENRDAAACPLYTARVIRGVTVGPSPADLVRRIEALGLRPVNNIVDITNFVLHELGQPLHAFDMAKLEEGRIIVRRAEAGERFTAIDGSKHTLRDDMLVIADAAKPQAIAGVMGGMDSEVGPETRDILLESACFNPLNIRTTSRALKLASDSSYRFERGVDPHVVDAASRRAAQLICELAAGELCGGVIAVGADLPAPRIVQMRPERCNALLGIDLPVQLMIQLLRALGLEPRLDGDLICCTIPTFRLDLHREADLIEEIARLHGYGHIPMQEKMKIVVRPPQLPVQARQTVARVLTAHGYCETITFSFLDPRLAEPFAGGLELVQVDESKKKAEPALRPSVLPSLLACRKSNQDAGNRDVRLFEVAQVFGRKQGGAVADAPGTGLPPPSLRPTRGTPPYVESRKLALLADAQEPAAALRSVRGAIEELLEAMGMAGRVKITQGETTPWAAPVAHLLDQGEDGRVIGTYGPATGAILKLFDLQTAVILAELDYASLGAAYPPAPRVSELPRFPAIERDLSVIVDEPVTWASVGAVVGQVRPALLEGVHFVTTYRGKPVPPGRKSVTLRMTFRDPQRTLKHEEVSEQVSAVVDALGRELKAELRVG